MIINLFSVGFLRYRYIYFMGMLDHLITLGKDTHNDLLTVAKTKTLKTYKGSMKDSFEDIVTDHSDSMYRFLMYRFNLKKQACDDIFQECLYRIYEKIHLYDKSKPLGPWIMTITYRTALDFLTKHQQSPDAYRDMSEIENFLDRMQEYTDSPSVELEKTYKEGLIRYMLSHLTEKNKTLLMLYYFEEKSYEEIAQIIGCKASGVGTLLSRAKEELAIRIESNDYLSQAIVL